MDKLCEWIKKTKGEEVFKAFLLNMHNQPEEHSILMQDRMYEQPLLGDCFLWNKTPEGFDFWNEMHDEYYEHCKGILFEKKPRCCSECGRPYED